jgi:hypothetical protein
MEAVPQGGAAILGATAAQLGSCRSSGKHVDARRRAQRGSAGARDGRGVRWRAQGCCCKALKACRGRLFLRGPTRRQRRLLGRRAREAGGRAVIVREASVAKAATWARMRRRLRRRGETPRAWRGVRVRWLRLAGRVTGKRMGAQCDIYLFHTRLRSSGCLAFYTSASQARTRGVTLFFGANMTASSGGVSTASPGAAGVAFGR